MIKKVRFEDKLQLKLIEVQKENIQLRSELLQKNLIKLQEDYNLLDKKYKDMIELINLVVGVDIRKYKLNEECEIVDNNFKVIEFEDWRETSKE